MQNGSRKIGRYRLERRLQEDYSPEAAPFLLVPDLYLARDTKRNLEVVVRILPPFRRKPSHYEMPREQMRRIVKGTIAARALSHRNICSIYAIGYKFDAGLHWVATEYVHAECLLPGRVGIRCRLPLSLGSRFKLPMPSLTLTCAESSTAT
jgi:hypothetical protein